MLFGRKAKLKWLGQEHELTITMELVESIDDAVNVLKTAVDLDKGGIPKITLIAKLYSVLLAGAGVVATKEEIYESIMASPADSKDLVAAARYVIGLCFPQLETSERTTSTKKQKG